MRRYKKPYRIKRKKSIWRNRFFRPAILFLIFFASLSYLLFFSEAFQIEKVAVSGGQIQLSLSGENMFLLDTQKLKKDILNEFPQIAKVEISRDFPDALNIFLTERQALAVWCEAEKCFLMDKDGVPFGEAPAETDLIWISGKKELIDEKKIGQIINIQSKLKKDLDIEITGASLISQKRLNIKVSEGWEIYFDLGGDLDWQITKLTLVLEKQIPPGERRNLEYVDLRFTKVYYK